MTYLTRTIEDEFEQILSYRAELIDNSFSHCLGHDESFSITLEDNRSVLLDDESVAYDDLGFEQKKLIDADLSTICAADFNLQF